jgi:hypothetical protein
MLWHSWLWVFLVDLNIFTESNYKNLLFCVCVCVLLGFKLRTLHLLSKLYSSHFFVLVIF